MVQRRPPQRQKYTAPIILDTGTATTLKAVTVAEGRTIPELLTRARAHIAVRIVSCLKSEQYEETSSDVDATSVSAECRADLIKSAYEAKAKQRNGQPHFRAVRCFARWKFPDYLTDAEARTVRIHALRDEAAAQGLASRRRRCVMLFFSGQNSTRARAVVSGVDSQGGYGNADEHRHRSLGNAQSATEASFLSAMQTGFRCTQMFVHCPEDGEG